MVRNSRTTTSPPLLTRPIIQISLQLDCGSPILASYNWRFDSPRYRRVARFVDELFGGVDKLRAPGLDPKWKEVSLATKAPGLERFQAAQDWLDRVVPS